ncbi:PREDICTED: uncharacterized protein LOC104822865 [Tarenaya hassleriana]|uniref:uncharacterized protein LOC104822865 n=1 Tax=Tarenaya hassleriana TaxID=28532 RepID=UPI00053C8E57|nr:PREDICTED: uncharacterized protein LOC104822865 [Tarenaya hassleriana]
MLSSSAFRGRPNVDPIPHLTRFKLLCQSVSTVCGVTDESLMLMAFPFFLTDTALEWLYTLPPDSIFSWEQCKKSSCSGSSPLARPSSRNNILTHFCRNLMNPYVKLGIAFKDTREHVLTMDGIKETLTSKTVVQVENAHQISSLDTSANGYMIGDVYYVDKNLVFLKDINLELEPPQHQNQSIQHFPTHLQYQQNYAPSPPPSQVDSALDLKSMFAQLMQGQEAIRTEIHKHQQETDAHLKLVDNQIAQLAASIPSRPQGSLPGKPETNSREHCNAVFLRSGKQLEYVIPPTPEKEASQFKHFTNMIKKLEVTIPFHEVITQMPSYAKFLKDILARKKTLENEAVALTKECSAVFQHDLPRASVSLMPLSIFKRLGVGELKPTQMILQLADRSTERPAGILEDMPLKVGDYYILVDFLVLDMDADSSMPIILGRPFLNTADVVIHVRAGRLTMSIGDKTIEFMLKQNDNPDDSVKSICSVYKLKTPKNQDHKHKVKRGPDPDRTKGVEQVTNSSDFRENWLESHASPPDFSLLGMPHFSNSFHCRDALKLHDPGWQKMDNLCPLDPSSS